MLARILGNLLAAWTCLSLLCDCEKSFGFSGCQSVSGKHFAQVRLGLVSGARDATSA